MSENGWTKVVNLSDPGHERYYALPPRESVICAYAQHTKNFWNTWEYERQYGHLVYEGEKTIACGDWCALREGVVDGEDCNP